MSQGAVSPLGILAGGGGLPHEVARVVSARGRGVHVVALEGEAEAWVETFPHTWVNWGGVGAMLEGFRSSGCREIVILGSVRRPNLRKIRPDVGFFLALPGLLKMLKGGDDSVLRRVVQMFEVRGLTVRGVHEVAPELVAPTGALASLQPDGQAIRAIEKGREAIAMLGPFDLGQAVIACPDGIVEIEGAEGTDAMLRRAAAAGAGVHQGPKVLVKAPKPGQEIRVDMPAIGRRTIELAAAAGLAGIAMESGAVLIAEKAQAVVEADRAELFLFGAAVGGERVGDGEQARTDRRVFEPMGQKSVREMDREDAAVGARVLDTIRPFWGAGAVVVSRGYVLAIERPEQAGRALERARRNKPWGMGLLKRGVGVLVIDAEQCRAALVEQAGEAGFAAVALTGSTGGDDDFGRLAGVADRHGLGLLAQKPGGAG